MKRFIPALLLILAGYCLAGQTPVDSSGTFLIGGIRQAVTIKAKDISNPLLLFLHGGPGNSVMHYAKKFTAKLEEHFIVVQWDQRNTGRTLALNKSQVPLTVGLFESDTHAIIDSLLNRFHRPKLYLVGHSWGTHLGFYIARNHPELLHAFVAIGPMVNQQESERMAIKLMTDRATQTKNSQALQELKFVRVPFENGEQLYFDRKWLLDYMGSKAKITRQQVEEWSLTWLPIFNEASKENLFKSATKIDCPVYFFVGRKDIQTSSQIAAEYYQKLIAKKELFWFEHSGHSVPTTEPEKMQQIIIGLKAK